MCWNYREYGKSRSVCYSSKINPYNVKLDAEKVLEFLINKIKIRGKIGVYGRSIGGIASTHLASKFSNFIDALIVDRTFNELDELCIRRLSGRFTNNIFTFIS